MRRIIILLIPLTMLLAPLTGRAQDRAALFPSRLGLETKWEAFQKQPLTPTSVAAMLKEDPDGGLLVRWGDARHTSIWAAVQRRLTNEPKLVADLRKNQEREAQTLVDQAGGDLDKLMPLVRRFPWADSVHQALLEIGLSELRRGNTGSAMRSFQDVLQRSADADLRARAQVGVWLAAAHEPHDAALDAAFQGIDLKATYTWLGKDMPAGEIRARLSTKKVAAPFDLKALDKKTLEAPGSASWVYDRPTIHRDGLAIAGPSLLAWFDGSQPKPKWTQTSPLGVSKDLFGTLIPGPFVPAVDSDRLYTRWGMQTLTKKVGSANFLVNVAAFDTRTDTQVWSTEANPDWQDLTPVNDPTLADGRLYLLAVSRTLEYSPIYLVCLEAQTGTLHWKREIVSNHTTLPGVPRVDVARHGNAVTLAGGLVYCSTNMGVVACCDGRDGLIEWVRTYPQDRAAALSRKHGAAPLAVGSRVVFLPRDASLVLAVDPATGDLAWLKADDGATALGVVDQSLLLATPRKLAALHLDTGKTRWDRPFQDSIDLRAILSGSAIYVATRSKLVRLDAKTGAIAEEQDWGKSDPAGGLALRDRTLYGANLGTEITPISPLPTVIADKAVRVVHRYAALLQIDGQTTEWDKFPTSPISGTGAIKGKVLMSHDDQNLYVGVTVADGDFRGNRLEFAITVDKKTSRWIITPDGQNGDAWEGIGSAVPAGVKAAAHQHLVNRTLTLEIAIPLASILVTKNPKKTGWGRLGVEYSLRPGDAQSSPLVRVAENVFLHRLTQEQETTGLNLATAFPEMDPSWLFLEQSWRARNPNPATSADFLRDFIKSQPTAPTVGQALVRLDGVLRKTITTDPSDDVLKLADEVGVPAPVRAWYKQVAGSYLSQWIYVDTTFAPQAIELELFDGVTRDHRVLAGTVPTQVAGGGGGGQPLTGAVRIVSVNGKTRMWIGGVEVDPRTRQPLGAAPVAKAGSDSPPKTRVIPLPPSGVWHEMRIPLLWIGIHDKPIHGLAFKQRGGSNIYWDRTALVVNGKEHVLFENDLAVGLPLGIWQLVDKPAKFGKKTHTTPHPQYKSEEVRHSVTFKDGFRAHIVTDPEREKDKSIADREKWVQFFSPMPEARDPKSAIRNWQVIGPFPIPEGRVGPDLENGVRLEAEYQTPAAKTRWKLHESPGERIDLRHLLAGEKAGIVYAACWIHSDAKQSALLRVSSDDRVQVWLNPKADAEPLINEPFFRTQLAGVSEAPIGLMPGWNVVLVKLDTRVGRCAFTLELLEKENRRPLEGIKTQAQPGKIVP